VGTRGNLFPGAFVQSCGLPMSLAYRTLDAVLAQRVAEERVRRAADAPGVQMARGVMASRFGRAAAGAVGVLMASAALLDGLCAIAFSGRHGSAAAAATQLLLFAWPLAGVAWVVGWAIARVWGARAVPELSAPDPDHALSWLEGADPLLTARTRAMRWEFASVALPLAALSLACPLTIHWLLVAVVDAAHGSSNGVTAKDFGEWIGLSAMFVGHAHLALAACAVLWASALRKCETHLLKAHVHRAWIVALLITTGVASVPFGIPGAITFVTGLLFIPLMYVVTAHAIACERAALA